MYRPASSARCSRRPSDATSVQDAARDPREAGSIANRTGTKTHQPLIAFLGFWLLAAALSWTALRFATAHDPRTAGDLFADPALLIAKFGPTISGLILVLLGSAAARRAFLASLIKLPPLWVALAIAVPGLLTVIALAATAVSKGMSWSTPITALSLPAIAYWIALRSLLGGGLGEEPGIRGVALPLLLKRTGPRTASIAIGLFWAAWHLPVLWGKPPLLWLGQTVLTTSGSLILTFVWLRVGPSLPIAIAFHGALNGWAAYASTDWIPTLAHAGLWPVLRLALLALIAIALLPLRWQPERGTRTDVT